jgi:uncharacterized lipoprotein YbaY
MSRRRHAGAARSLLRRTRGAIVVARTTAALPDAMRHLLAVLLALSGAFAAPAASANPDGDETVIIGTINYRGATAFPRGAKVVLQLVDLSRPMTSSSVISELVFLDPKPVAWPYQIQYPGAAIDPKGLYGIFAKVVVGAEVLFATLQAAPVITQGHPSKRDLLLEPVPRRAAAK